MVTPELPPMAREGWSIKSAAAVLGVHPKKAPQAMDPAFRKVALLMLADPVATHIELLNAMEAARRAIAANGVDLDITRLRA